MDITGQVVNKDQIFRIAIIVDSFYLPNWVAKVIEDIEKSSIAKINLIITNNIQLKNKKNFVRRIFEEKNYLIYLSYTKFDNWFFHVEPDAFHLFDIRNLLPDCPILYVTLDRISDSDFLDDDINALKSYSIDIALQFSSFKIKGEILYTAKFGIWAYHHGDVLSKRGGPPGFWEVMEGNPVTGSTLQILSEELDKERILYRSFAATDKRSVRRNCNSYYWKSSKFVMRKIKQLSEEGDSALNDDSYEQTWTPYHDKFYSKPTNGQMLKCLSKYAGRYLKEKFYNLKYFDQWGLIYYIKNGMPFPYPRLYDYDIIVPPKDRFWADCFPIIKNDKYYIFMEEYIYKDKKGHISCIEMDYNGNYTKPLKVLEKDYHMSYPCIFKYKNDYYMIPETQQNRTIELYRCLSFPDEWELIEVLFKNLRAVDATIEMVNNRYWMFVNIAEYGADVLDELHLFYSETPFGPWISHRKNPIKSNIRCARPAGHIFMYKGKYFRPSHDFSLYHGYGICINQIDIISEKEYKEVVVSRILPEWDNNIIGLHTINQVGGLTVIDVFRKRRKGIEQLIMQ